MYYEQQSQKLARDFIKGNIFPSMFSIIFVFLTGKRIKKD